MKWMVTTERSLSEALLDLSLQSAGAHLVHGGSTPLGTDEEVWEVEGPVNLDKKLSEMDQIKEIYPSSELTYY